MCVVVVVDVVCVCVLLLLLFVCVCARVVVLWKFLRLNERVDAPKVCTFARRMCRPCHQANLNQHHLHLQHHCHHLMEQCVCMCTGVCVCAMYCGVFAHANDGNESDDGK